MLSSAEAAIGAHAALAVLARPDLSALYPRLAGRTAIPVTEGVTAAVEAVVGLAINAQAPLVGGGASPAATTGISPALAEAIRRRRARP